MINQLLEIVAPHHCYGCQKIGMLLCDNCKYDIKNESFSRCIRCARPAGSDGICLLCANAPFTRAWCIGERHDALEQLIDGYKFGTLLDATRVLGVLLAETMPVIPPDACLVPIPTIASHIRVRGYDHTYEMVRKMRRQLGCHATPLLRRKKQTVQRGASRTKRLEQAKQAFYINRRYQIDPDTPYIVVDDVYTTGATIDAAGRLLREAGAQTVWVAVATREPLD